MPTSGGPCARVRAAGFLLLTLLAPACSPAFDLPMPAPDTAAAPVRRPLVPQPRLTLATTHFELAPGERVVLSAHPDGGEAILFSVDWAIREGSAGGSLVPEAGRHDDGSYTAVYQAPGVAGGPFHVSVTLHEFPAVGAEASIQVRPSP